MGALVEGTVLEAQRLGEVRVGRLLGEGGQGKVFEASCRGKQYALKWLHVPDTETARRVYEEQRTALKGSVDSPGLIERGAPDSRFLWPLDFVEDGEGQFGYVMDLRPGRYRAADEVVNGLIPSPKSGPYRRQVNVCQDLVDCFRVLHTSGYVYQDVNLGGPFFDFETGEALLCDNDNVRPNGAPGYFFTKSLAAPEVVRGESPLTIRTDEHSLAVLLYYIWVRGHPLQGARDARAQAFNEDWERMSYGSDPRFMFHPEDETNRPVQGIHDAAVRNWQRLPNFMRAAFQSSFTDGLADPEKRLTDTQWARTLSRLRDSLFRCAGCGKETFYDRALVKDVDTQLACVWCGHRNSLPTRIRVGRRNNVVMLTRYSRLFAHHFNDDFDFKKTVAEVVTSRGAVEVGLRNVSDRKWTYKANDGALKEVVPNGVLALGDRLEVNFGAGTGSVAPKS